ncbi:hypothetical protein ACFE04_000940 [Oxalis oulophora]
MATAAAILSTTTTNPLFISTTTNNVSSSSCLTHSLVCKASSTSPSVVNRRGLTISFITGSVFFLSGKSGPYNINEANAFILEADDDEVLMEKVKMDRKKRLEKQGVLSTSNQEKGYLQELVYKLSTVGQAIENNDLATAGSVLGGSTNTDWVQKANLAFNKISSSPEEKSEVDVFNSSLASLISSVTQKNIEASKVAFVTSASAFEKWTTLSGLVGQLKGL